MKKKLIAIRILFYNGKDEEEEKEGEQKKNGNYLLKLEKEIMDLT